GTVLRPAGTELLGFEGEIAVVIGTPARNVSPEEAWQHVGWVTASNDLALHDLRYADKGSNVRSKGGDGFTPVGPKLLDAGQLNPEAIGLRTWLNDELVQDDSSADMLFSFGLMIADLSRVMTLERGDIILTGTPAGASVAQPGDRIAVEVFALDDPSTTTGRLETDVDEGPGLADWGNPPLVDDAQRADAWGQPIGVAPGTESPVVLDDALRERLNNVSTATLSVHLRQRGFDHAVIDGVKPLAPGRRLVGTARTLRYVPYRKDLFAQRGSGFTPQKQAIESLEAGDVLVMEARGETTSGTLGDILALRAQLRGAAGVVTDGGVRDAALVADLGLPVYTVGAHPSVLGRRHVPWDQDVTIACGGATVQVGDVIVGDDDGVLVIPPHLVLEVLEGAEAQEEQERFIVEMVEQGESVDGLYPIGPAWKPKFEEWQARQRSGTSP
ncbi:MAG TPA: fumarylacetoacetate hydrolase family protein, partial [Actinomycetaceae bacterium]|nr:fumarylacetoacetate hydrolase family protein [Actinomycetaceae bacterium]